MKSMKPQEPLIRVVDDEEEVRDSLKFMLECEGWLVSAYASGFDLLKDFDRSRPGCILLDVRMPDLSGPELQEKLNLMGSRVPLSLSPAIPTFMQPSLRSRPGPMIFF